MNLKYQNLTSYKEELYLTSNLVNSTYKNKIITQKNKKRKVCLF